MILRSLFLVFAALFLLAMVAFLTAPIFIGASVSWTSDDFLAFPPVGMSLRWYRNILVDPVWRAALGNSLIVGVVCTVIATSVGTLTAYGISRIENLPLRRLLVVLFILPLAVPHMSLAMSFYPVFAKLGLIGTRFGVALGQSLFALPFVILSVLAVIRRRDLELERAARTLGAGPLDGFRLVVLPQLTPGIAAGAVLAFMTSFDDVTVPIFLSGTQAGTVPKAMLDALAMNSDPSVMAASTAIAVVGLVLFVAGSWLSRTRSL